MKLNLSTSVGADLKSVKSGFNQQLFEQLSPPFPKVRLIRFDGSKEGDLVSLKINFVFFSQKWTSEIMEEAEDEQFWQFVDKGIELPFFLKRWRHIHRVEMASKGAVIRDQIQFSSGYWFFDLIIWPAMWLQFAYRKPIYRRIFKK